MSEKDQEETPEADPVPTGPPANATIRNREVILGSPNSRARLDAPFRTGVVVPADAPLSEADKSLLAAAAQQPISWIQSQRDHEQPIVVGAGIGKQAATALHQRWQNESLPVELIGQWSFIAAAAFWIIGAFIAGGLVLAGSLLGVAVGILGIPALGLTGPLLGAALALVQCIIWCAWALRQRSKIRTADAAWDAGRQAQADRAGSPDLKKCWEALFDIRTRLPHSGLPDIALRDIREALSDVEQALVNIPKNSSSTQSTQLEHVRTSLEIIGNHLNPSGPQTTDLNAALQSLSTSTRLGKEAISGGAPDVRPPDLIRE